MNIKKLIIFFIIAIVSTSECFSKIEDSIYVTVGNKAITHSDIINEIKIILILNGQTYSEKQKTVLEKAALKSVIKREIKKIELEKFKDLKFNPTDLDDELNKLADNLNIDLPTLKDSFIANEINFANIVEQMKTELLWNTLIFELYKNRLTINKDEIQEQLETIDTTGTNKVSEEYLMSEIVMPPVEKDKIEEEIKKIKDRISTEGFSNVALSLSISESAERGGDIGWVSEKVISNELKTKIQNTSKGEISEPIFLKEGILLFLIRDKKLVTQSEELEKTKNRLVQIEKAKILRMFSLTHYDSIKRSTAIKYH
jgi:peptidyl-prolyl cis-trans isomerase SurA